MLKILENDGTAEIRFVIPTRDFPVTVWYSTDPYGPIPLITYVAIINMVRSVM